MSSPWGLENSVSVILSSAALVHGRHEGLVGGLRIVGLHPSPKVSAMAMAASLPEGIMSPASARLKG